ncbi:MAG: hypothetical protein Q8R02_23490 [Hyphomonadaceae bacterium]|nr:hypothetical protein [Hyphomonadaceae bacterium]
MQMDAKPEDREQIALWIQKFKTEHKPGPDGNLIAVDRVYLGKKGIAGFQNVHEVKRLKKDNPFLWDKLVGPAYEQWQKGKAIPRDGLPLEAWPAITEGQIEMCKTMGLHTVEDIATATDSIRQKLGMGANTLIQLAKSFNANKDATATANKIAGLEAQLAESAKAADESRQLIDMLMAERGKAPGKPGRKPKQDLDEAA